jgi:hypothetical protein
VIVGGYELHLYCDNVPDRPWLPGDRHPHDAFPHTDWGNFEHGYEARAMARRCGWALDLKKGRALCPLCNPRSRQFLGPNQGDQHG